MKRVLPISFVCLAVTVTLLSGMIRHHHHDGGFCTETIEHTGDERSRDTDSHGFCIAESEFTDRMEREDGGDCDSAVCGHEGHALLFATVCASIFLFPYGIAVETDFGEYITSYDSACIRATGGLRAPPAILC